MNAGVLALVLGVVAAGLVFGLVCDIRSNRRPDTSARPPTGDDPPAGSRSLDAAAPLDAPSLPDTPAADAGVAVAVGVREGRVQTIDRSGLSWAIVRGVTADDHVVWQLIRQMPEQSAGEPYWLDVAPAPTSKELCTAIEPIAGRRVAEDLVEALSSQGGTTDLVGSVDPVARQDQRQPAHLDDATDKRARIRRVLFSSPQGREPPDRPDQPADGRPEPVPVVQPVPGP